MIAAGVHAGNLGAMPYRVIPCANCRYDFAPVVPWQRFCCKTCRNEYHYDQNRDTRIEYQRDYRAYLKSIKPIKRNTTDLADEVQGLRDENAELRKEIGDLKDLVGELVETVKHQNKLLKERPVAQSSESQPTTRAPSKPQTSIDDIELEITQAKTDENNKSHWNFIISSALNVYGNVDSLAPEIIDYGVRVGKIPAGMVKRDKSVTSKNPKAMDVPQFTAPEFDDMRIE